MDERNKATVKHLSRLIISAFCLVVYAMFTFATFRIGSELPSGSFGQVAWLGVALYALLNFSGHIVRSGIAINALRRKKVQNVIANAATPVRS